MEKIIDGKVYELGDNGGCGGCAFAIFSDQCYSTGIECTADVDEDDDKLSWKLKPTEDGKTN